MESPICFELSYDSSWDNDSRVADIQRCLSTLSILYANTEAEASQIHANTFMFELRGISKSMIAEELRCVPQMSIERHYRIDICLRHEKQIARVSIADNVDLSLLRTAMFYYLEYYISKYQALQDRKSIIQEERYELARRVAKLKGKVTLLQQREMLEDDDILLEALDQLYVVEEEHKKNGVDLFEVDQAIGRLVRFKEV
jgi:hypothetical protein